MTDYIKREDAMELLDMLLEHYHDTGIEVIKHTAAIAPKEFHISEEDDIADFNFEIDGWKKDFSAIPSADVAPVRHGRWIEGKLPIYRWGGEKIGEKSTWKCSVCHDVGFWGYNYCPNCGAHMMDGDENDD